MSNRIYGVEGRVCYMCPLAPRHLSVGRNLLRKVSLTPRQPGRLYLDIRWGPLVPTTNIKHALSGLDPVCVYRVLYGTFL